MEVSYVLGKLLQLIQIPQIHNSEIDKTAKVRFRSIVVGSKVGRYSYISENTSVLYCTIGAFSSIASDCFIGGAAHPTEWVSTSPMFQKLFKCNKKKNCEYSL